MPVVFTIFASSANYLYGESIDEFLASQAALGLTVVLMIPILSHSKSFDDKLSVSHLYVLLIFLGFILSTTLFIYKFRKPNAFKKSREQLLDAGVLVFFWLPLLIPFRSVMIHNMLRRVLSSAPHDGGSPASFNGKPGGGPALDLDTLRPLFASPKIPGKSPLLPNGVAVSEALRIEAESTSFPARNVCVFRRSKRARGVARLRRRPPEGSRAPRPLRSDDADPEGSRAPRPLRSRRRRS